MTDLETILSWFQTGDLPTEEEFQETFSSFRLKNTKIPIAEVDKLELLLNSKINADDYIKDGKIKADKIEALGLTELIESSEKDISEFAENSDKYEFQQNDFIAFPDDKGNFSLYLFKGGEKKDKSNYLPMAAMLNSTDTLETVMNRGNVAPKEIQFHDNGKLSYDISLESYLFTSGKSETATGKYNTGVGNKVFSKLTSGYENTGMGGKVLEELTTGYYNAAYGSFTLSKTTTGIGNTGIGYASFYSTTTGSGNTGLGLNSGQNNVAGSINTYVGYRAGFSSNGSNNVFVGGGSGANHGATTGSKNFGNNTFLGYYSGYTSHAMGTWGDNNVVIGSYAPLGGGVNNQLVIDSYMSAKRHDFVSPLIGGDFAARTLSFDASLQIRRLPNAERDPTYTRQLVQKEDGTVGYVDSETPVKIYFNINTAGVIGNAFYIKKGEVATAYVDIKGTVQAGAVVQLEGETFKSTNRKIDLMTYTDNGVDVTGLTGEALIVSTQDYYPGIYIKNVSNNLIDFIIKETFTFIVAGNVPV